jgi:hypothetical protein
VQNTMKKRRSTMNMQPAITEKPPSTRQAVSKKRRDTMPTSHTATTYTLFTMRKRRQRITPQSTIPPVARNHIIEAHTKIEGE